MAPYKPSTPQRQRKRERGVQITGLYKENRGLQRESDLPWGGAGIGACAACSKAPAPELWPGHIRGVRGPRRLPGGGGGDHRSRWGRPVHSPRELGQLFLPSPRRAGNAAGPRHRGRVSTQRRTVGLESETGVWSRLRGWRGKGPFASPSLSFLICKRE